MILISFKNNHQDNQKSNPNNSLDIENDQSPRYENEAPESEVPNSHWSAGSHEQDIVNILEDEGDEESYGFMNIGSNSRSLFNRDNPFGLRGKVGRSGEGRNPFSNSNPLGEGESSGKEDDIKVKQEDDEEENQMENDGDAIQEEILKKGGSRRRLTESGGQEATESVEKDDDNDETDNEEGEEEEEGEDGEEEETDSDERDDDDDDDDDEEGGENDDDGDDNQESGEEDGSGEEDDDSDSESSEPSRPVVAAVKEMQFRSNRGSRINYLIAKEKLETQTDDFWKENKYFGSNINSNI